MSMGMQAGQKWHHGVGRGHANSTGIPPDQKVNKASLPISLYTLVQPWLLYLLSLVASLTLKR